MQYSGITLTPGLVITAATDPQFNYVTALLDGDGTNAGTNNTFLDSSPNNFTVTRSGSTTQGSYSPYGTLWSNYFNGSTDYLSVPYNTAFQFTTVNFTIEFWVNFTSVASGQNIINGYVSGASNLNYAIYTNVTGRLDYLISADGANWNIANAAIGSISVGQWYHVALVRNGSVFTPYLNGVAGTTTTSAAAIFTNTSSVYIGASINGAGSGLQFFNGYISNLRVVKGTAVYTSTFTPSTTPLTAITNTSLLTCQTNRFKDNSTNNFTVTTSGSPSVQVYSPFGTTTQYDPTVNGGSGYFNGSTDYLTITNTTALQPGTGDFTYELWWYANNISSTQEMVSKGSGVQIFTETSVLKVALSSNNTGTFFVNTTFGTPKLNAWNHIAIVRSGNNYYGYLNGNQTLVVTSASSPDTGTDPLIIGGFQGGLYLTGGFISNFRFVKGTAVYTTNFLPPTAPVISIANTSLLLNFTNGQVFDSGMMSNYGTFGAAQISTSVVKYGTGSIAFNGSTSFLSAPNALNYTFGTGDFTIEFWLYVTALPTNPGYAHLFDNRPISTQGAYPMIYLNSDGTIRLYVSSADRITSSVISISTWYHVAVSRSSGTTKMFINGTQAGSSYTDANSYLSSSVIIGAGYSGGASISNFLNGYLDEYRISKGIARYTANFTPPTSLFPSTGNIQSPANAVDYLVVGGGGGGCQGGNSGSGGGGGGAGGLLTGSSSISTGTTYTVTVGAGGAGGASAAAQGASGVNSSVTFFNPRTFSASFNGTNQYLTIPSNALLNLETASVFTVEAWVYIPSTGTAQSTIVGNRGNSGVSGWEFRISTSRNVQFYYTGGSTLASSSAVLALNTWYHLAVVRNSGTALLFINGTLSQTTTSITNGTNSSNVITIGCEGTDATTFFVGYISNLRIVNGIAVYTSTFTPSLNPLTATQLANVNGAGSAAITGTQTSLLTLQNATIIDNSTNIFTITNNGSVTTSQTISPLSTVLAYGGGGGSTAATGGIAGGSGGGTSGPYPIGVGTSGQGNSGGSGATDGATYTSAGGGGGAGAVGGTSTGRNAANGGAGTASTISGTSVTYAGGGAGSPGATGTTGTGGSGGGGATATSGTANTGGGAGGSIGGVTAGTGGSGIVILRFPTSNILPASTTGSPSLTTPSGYNVYTWTSSGSITF